MAGPYDYTINIPQPPAQNFLQSLMGIRQLQQMEQQNALQQQQSAFQQQMQPLEMEKARAAIAAQQSALAGSEQSRRQNEILFKQQQEERLIAKEQQAVAQAKQNELFGRLTSLPADAPMGDVVKIANELALYKPEVSKQVMANFESYPQNFQKAAETALITATTQLESDDIEGARKTYANLAEAIKNSGAKDNPQLRSLINSAESQAKLLGAEMPIAKNIAKLSSLQLLGAINPKALDSIVGIEEKQADAPLKVAQARLAEADAKLKELKATGKLDAEEIMKQETARRENFISQPFVRNYPIRRDAYNIVTGAEKTPIGDSSKIVAFIKLQDPGSVVSVTEKGQITTTTPIASLQSLVSKFNNEGLLDSKTRRDIDTQSKNIFESAKYDFEQFKKRETTIAKRYGLNPENIVSAFDVEERPQAEPMPPAVSPVAPGQPISTGTLPVAPAGGIFTIDGMEMKIVPRKK